MALENGLYAKVFMIHRKELYYKKVRYRTKKYNFQGQSVRTKNWFDLDHEWLKENFITCEPYFYKNESN